MPSGFDWDAGNTRKNEKHGVTNAEIEQVFLNAPLVVVEDVRNSQLEPRQHALGRTDENRWLHITFTLRHRGESVRPISARAMNRKEQSIYEQAIEANSQIH